MIFLSIDFETTGADKENDRIIEFGAVMYSTGQHKCLESQGMLVKTDVPIPPEIVKLTNITPVAVEKFGYDSEDMLRIVLDMAENSNAYLGYNIRRFDYPMLKNWAKRHGETVPDRPVVDLFQDLPWKVPVSKLGWTLADHGALNLFPHSALSDAQSVVVLATKYDTDMLMQRAQSPVVVLRSYQNRGENDLVKQAPFRFRWNPDNDKKFWWRLAKEQDVEEIIKEAPFRIEVEKRWTPEELDS